MCHLGRTVLLKDSEESKIVGRAGKAAKMADSECLLQATSKNVNARPTTIYAVCTDAIYLHQESCTLKYMVT